MSLFEEYLVNKSVGFFLPLHISKIVELILNVTIIFDFKSKNINFAIFNFQFNINCHIEEEQYKI